LSVKGFTDPSAIDEHIDGQVIQKLTAAWLQDENPRLVQMIKEYSGSTAILEATTDDEEKAASANLFKILPSSHFLKFCLGCDAPIINAYCSMIDIIDGLATDPDKAAPIFVERQHHLVELLAQHAGRQLRPLGVVETMAFLCDLLRKNGHLIVKQRPGADQSVKDCDVICSEPGCYSLETVVFSQETINRLDQGKLIWRCSKHRTT
jgi:hypothetical protein